MSSPSGNGRIANSMSVQNGDFSARGPTPVMTAPVRTGAACQTSCDSIGSQLITRVVARSHQPASGSCSSTCGGWVAAVQPLQRAVRAALHLVAQRRRGQSQVFLAQVVGQRGIGEQHAHFGIEVGRARVDVERADEAALAVDHERLGVQAGTAAAEQALGELRAVAADFEQVHAAVQQSSAVALVTAVHGRHIVRGQRVGDHADPGAGMRQRHQRGGATLAGHEVGRDQQHLAVHAGQMGGQPRLPASRCGRRPRLQRRIGSNARCWRSSAPAFMVGQSLRRGRGGDPLQVDLRSGSADSSVSRATSLCRCLGVCGFKRLDRHRRAGVPERVEDGAGVGHRRAEQQHVQVAEVHAAAGVEVFVADVAPADHRQPAVDDPRLVVHAMVDAEETLHHFQQAPHAAAVAERVVQPHLDVRMRVQRQQRRIAVPWC